MFFIYFIIFNTLFNGYLSNDVNTNIIYPIDRSYNFTDSTSQCIPSWKNTIKISDAGNTIDSLVFGTSPGGTNGIDTCLGEIPLPPIPPYGAFDVRFVSQNDFSKIDFRKDHDSDFTWIIFFQPSPSGFPLNFQWDSTSFPSTGYFYLKDYSGGNTININMRNQGNFILTNSNIYLLKIEYSRIKINLKVSPEGLYFPLFNQLSRRDTFSVYLRNITAPYSIIDSAKGVIDSVTISNIFAFPNATAGSYYIAAKHFNSIETWSKAGGTNITTNGIVYTYDFTSSIGQAYGNNLQLKSGKYCTYSGDVEQNGIIDLTDLVMIFNNARNFVTGRYIPPDLNGDSIVDLTDISLCYNNSYNFVRKSTP